MPGHDEVALQEAIQNAADLADTAPEKYQQAAFRELLRSHLQHTRPEPSSRQDVPEGKGDRRSSTVGSAPELQPWERTLIEGLPDASTAAEGTRSQQAVWAVVRLLEDREPADVNAVRQTIKTELGLTPASKNNTSTTLKDLVPDYLSRTEPEEGQAYVYHPTRNALDIFGDSE